MKKAIVLLIMSASWCISGMEENQEASSSKKFLLTQILEDKKSQALPSQKGCMADQVLPEMSEYIFPYYWDRNVLDEQDKNQIQGLHDWYCELWVQLREKITQGETIVLSREQCKKTWDLIDALMEKYNDAPNENKIEGMHITDSLTKYLEGRLLRLHNHRNQLCGAHKKSVEELHRWFHSFLNYQRLQTSRAVPKIISYKLYKNIMGSMSYLESQAHLPTLEKPRLPFIKDECFWEVFDSYPDFENIIENHETNSNPH